MRSPLKIAAVCQLLLTITSITGCHHGKKGATFSVVLVCDVSASIEESARASCFRTVDSLLPALHRGDSLAVVPVTGDAEAEASGQILRFPIPAQRELYDQDLRRLRVDAEKKIGELATSAALNPAAHTDLLGTVQVVAQELGSLPTGQTGIVIVLTDGIQDDGQFNFNRAPELGHKSSATILAADLARASTQRFPDTQIYFGYLKSRDLARLSRSRRDSIQVFWTEYLRHLGARPQTVIDGPGLLPRFLEQLR